MKTFRTYGKSISQILLACFFSMIIYLPVAQAGIVSTDHIISADKAASERGQLENMLKRDDLAKQFEALGVDATEIQNRINSLTDEEVLSLNSQIQNLHAGGGNHGNYILIGTIVIISLMVIHVLLLF